MAARKPRAAARPASRSASRPGSRSASRPAAGAASRLVVQDATGSKPDAAYVPGVCNIGPWEIRKRWMTGYLGIASAVLLLVALAVSGAPAAARLVVLFPAWGGVFSMLQARRRFCGAYALRGVSNFGDTYATVRNVTDEAAHRADMAGLFRLTRDSFVVGLVLAVVAALLPL